MNIMLNMESMTWQPFVVGLFTSFAISLVLVMTKHLHSQITADRHQGIQKIHTDVTPRVGGVSIFVGAIFGWYVAPANYFGGMFWTLLVASIPAFFFGFLEDITNRVSVSIRLLATMVCSFLGYALTDFSITDLNVYVLDWFMQFTLISLLFTAFAVAGVANALNIIDGFNGLASGTVLIISAAFYWISLDVGDRQLSYICILIFSTTLGIFVVNWPLGKLFIGDGGAYFVGFAIAWVAVLLMGRHPEISAWAPLLVCGYPVLEVIFSMLRRYRRGLKVGMPDRMHLHSLFMRRVTQRLFPCASKLAQNSITGGVLLLCNVPPVLIAMKWHTNTPVLICGFICIALAYHVIYMRLTQFRWVFVNGRATVD